MAKLVRIDEFRNARFRPKWRPAEAIPLEPRVVAVANGRPVTAALESVSAVFIPAHLEPSNAVRLPLMPLIRYSPLLRFAACYNAADAPFEGTVALPRLKAKIYQNETVFQAARAEELSASDELEPAPEPPLAEDTPTEAFTVSLFPKRATRPGVVIPRMPAAGLMYLRTHKEPQLPVREARKEGPLEVHMAADGPIIRVDIAASGPALPDFGFLRRGASSFNVRAALRPGLDAVGMPVHELRVPDWMTPFDNGYVAPAGRPFSLADSARREAAPSEPVTLAPAPAAPVTPEAPAPAFSTCFTGPGERMISGVEPADVEAELAPPVYPAVKLPDGSAAFPLPSLTSRFFARSRFEVRVPPAMQLEDVSFSSAQPRLPVRLPRAPDDSRCPVVVCMRVAKPEWRFVSGGQAAPVRALSQGDPREACEYRTRSML